MVEIFRKAAFSLLLALLITAAGYPAPDAPLEVTLDKDVTTIGEPVRCRIMVKESADKFTFDYGEKRVYFPDEHLDDSDPARHLPLYEIVQVNRGSEEGAITIEARFFRPGTWAFPLPEMTLRGEPLETDGPTLTVKSVNPKGEFADIEPSMELSGNYTRLILLVIGIILLVALAAFLVYWIRKKRIEKQKPPVPPFQRFHEDIERMGPERLIEINDVEAYAVAISTAFRRYLSALGTIDAMELTTDELDRRLRGPEGQFISPRYRDEIIREMRLWDLAKFAEFTPDREALHENLKNILRLARRINREESILD
jgi:hypothetical protein